MRRQERPILPYHPTASCAAARPHQRRRQESRPRREVAQLRSGDCAGHHGASRGLHRRTCGSSQLIEGAEGNVEILRHREPRGSRTKSGCGSPTRCPGGARIAVRWRLSARCWCRIGELVRTSSTRRSWVRPSAACSDDQRASQTLSDFLRVFRDVSGVGFPPGTPEHDRRAIPAKGFDDTTSFRLTAATTRTRSVPVAALPNSGARYPREGPEASRRSDSRRELCAGRVAWPITVRYRRPFPEDWIRRWKSAQRTRGPSCR